MRHLDYPPVWLGGALLLAWAQARLWPMALAPAWLTAAGALLALLGIGLLAAAALQFLRAGTTIVPHRMPAALITQGPYRFSRNPIYLGDALILAGLILWWQAWAMVWLLPAFVVVIDRRFVRPEEARLRATFGAAFDAYAARVRRWL